ncbi:MAG: TolC family protein [Planctomycetota bacterium]
MIEQNLPYSSQASLGTEELEPIEHWPEADYPNAQTLPDPIALPQTNEPLCLSLTQALQIGARNNFEYQTLKEDVFRSALELDLQRNEFRNIFAGRLASFASTDSTGDRTVSGIENSADIGLSRRLENGVELTGALAFDLVKLLTANGASSTGIAGDGTVMVPLLRGSGKHIVREPLTQAERDVVYSIYEFERFKRVFAVGVAREYLGVLRQLDRVKNAENNYRRRMESARRYRRLAEAGRLTPIQVDQAVQREFRARDSWIGVMQSYANSLDLFRNRLGLPTDAEIELDESELARLIAPASELIDSVIQQEQLPVSEETPPADAPVELVAPSREEAGPLEMDQTSAVKLALDNRLDLRIAQGQVYDAQRAVVVAADTLGAELTFFGAADLGERRSLDSATADDAQLRPDKARYSALMTLDLPLERTAERNFYRNSFIALERAVRDVQALEDDIKLSVRDRLRDLLESREGLKTQAQALLLAEKRVDSVELFLEAGRPQTQVRDLLEAQDDLVRAQDELTGAVVDHRIAELELQSDMGVLKIDDTGLWQEYSPEQANNAAK